MVYFCSEILPKLVQKKPEIHLTIIGANPTEDIKRLSNAYVTVLGYVPNVTPYLMNHYISIAPLRYGAGMKGKVTEAMAHGTPIVSTSVGVQGMNIRHREEVMVADTPDDFAQCIEALINDENLHERLSNNSILYAKENYTIEKVTEKMLGIIDDMKNIPLKKMAIIQKAKIVFRSLINLAKRRDRK